MERDAVSVRSAKGQVRRLWIRLSLALAAAAGLWVTGAVLQRQTHEATVAVAGRIALVERQREGLLRILALADEHVEEGGSENRDRLVAAAQGFERARLALGAPVDAEGARRFGALAGEVAASKPGSAEGVAALAALVGMGTTEMPAALDASEAALHAEFQTLGRQETWQSWGPSALAFAVLALAAIGALRPVLRNMAADHAALRANNDAIRKRNDELEIRARNLSLSAALDPLTGLANRQSMHEFLARILSEEGGSGQVCVLHVDLDHFKELNDSHGHATGDAALKRVAEIMRARVRRDDLVARVGGDEFVIALTGTGTMHQETVQRIGEELIAKIREPMLVSGADLRLGASVGYAFSDEMTRSADMLIANADMALYEAKRAGKGMARAFTGGMREKVSRRNAMIRDIERALEEGAFLPYFQPILSLETGAVEGVEMLARWAHPERGLIHPSDFMDVAEEIGLVDAIEARVLLDGLDAMAALRQGGREVPRLTLNASARSMRYEDFAERLTDAVRARGFEPGDIAVEVLESTFVTGSRDQIGLSVEKLRRLGYLVFVDDFGSAYSSLQMLSELDVNGLKIDPALIAEIDRPQVRQVVEAIMGLARALSLSVVARGLESPRAARRLLELGAELGQGAGFAAPMPAGEFAAWLDGRRAAA